MTGHADRAPAAGSAGSAAPVVLTGEVVAVPDADIIEAIGARVVAEPDRVAVSDGEDRLTYRELWRVSGTVAADLGRAGIQAGSRVEVSVPRGLRYVLAALGVLRSGGALMPADPTYPATRLEQMRRAARPAAVVTGSLRVAAMGPGPDRSGPEGLDRSPDDVYYLFTSGSTGPPKGVAMPRGTLNNLIYWQLNELQAPSPPRTALFAPTSFDVSLQELLTTLAAGGCAHVVPDPLRGRPDTLLTWLAANGITHLFLPYVGLQMLAVVAATASTTVRLRLRHVITAGEALKCTPDLVAMFERLDGCRLTNQYGPVETHVVTRHTLVADPTSWSARPPIGTPIWNTQLVLLGGGTIDRPGELAIAGRPPARGYVGDRARDNTAAAFVPDSTVDGGRYYRTGDFGYVEGGELHFLGRRDDQVKIAGYRVQLSAVESLLLAYPGVRDAICAVTDADPLTRRLGAVLAAPAGLDPDLVRAFVARQAPDYMVPRRLLVVAEVPVTASGKADRRAAGELLRAAGRRGRARTGSGDPDR